ncbi:MAG: hypothetical protein GX325_07605 [Peptococcaceae bacterium]|nr:hypothetical protein [Peptococcaceae bacterium]
MDWFANNWELALSFAVALFILWMVFFKQEYESRKGGRQAGQKTTKDSNSKKDKTKKGAGG